MQIATMPHLLPFSPSFGVLCPEFGGLQIVKITVFPPPSDETGQIVPIRVPQLHKTPCIRAHPQYWSFDLMVRIIAWVFLFSFLPRSAALKLYKVKTNRIKRLGNGGVSLTV